MNSLTDMIKDQTRGQIQKYYAEKYSKREDESWDAFWKRVEKLLIRQSKDRRDRPVFKQGYYV